jgi:rhodanese-related sulfurtransferase
MHFLSLSHSTKRKYPLYQRIFQNFILSGALFSLLLLPAISCSASGNGPYKSWSVEQAKRMLDSNANIVVLDVRTQEEFSSETGHLKNALLIPVQELETRIAELASHKKQTILVYCRSGSRSKRASELLVQQGFTPVNMDGGIMAWNQANLPIVR